MKVERDANAFYINVIDEFSTKKWTTELICK